MAEVPKTPEKTSARSDMAQPFPVKPFPIFLGLAIFTLLRLLPAPEGLSPEGWAVISVAALMIIWWITEAIPVPATSLIPVALLPTVGARTIGATTAPYGDPVIFLFLGGFVLAIAMERWELHRRIALNILTRTGSRQHHIVGGFMLATAFCGMWVSNTATAVMMLPVALSVTKLLEGTAASSKFPLALMLSVAYAASIGGVSTLIGTPPNAILAGTMNQAYGYEITFASWMIFGMPIAIVMLIGCWLILTRFAIRLDTAEIPGAGELFREQLSGLGGWSSAEIRVGLVFVVTASAWIFRGFLSNYIPGLTDSSIAICAALALFLIPSGGRRGGALVDWNIAKSLPWGILVLFGGGLSLASAVVGTGVDTWIGELIGARAEGLSLFLVVVMVAVVVLVFTEFTSNTATAAAFVPLVAALAVTLGENPLMLAVPAALASSMSFMLPVATPPNALVFASGHVTVQQMAKQGLWLNILSLFVISILAYWLLIAFFGVTVGEIPDWVVPQGGLGSGPIDFLEASQPA